MEKQSKVLLSISNADEADTTNYEKSNPKFWSEIHHKAIECDLSGLEEILNDNDNTINSLAKVSKKHLENYHWIDTSDIKSSYSNTALLLLLKYSNPTNKDYLNCIQLLVDFKINTSHKDSDGIDAHNLLIDNDKRQEIERILQTGRTLAPSDFPFDKNDEQIEQMLISNQISASLVDGDDTDLSSITLLQWCCKKGYVNSIKKFLSKNVNPHQIIKYNPKYPILYLAKNKNINKTDLLLFTDDLPLNILPQWMNTKSILQAENDSTNIILKYFENLSNKDEYINFQDDMERTALHYAALNGLEKYFKKLLTLGASLIIRDKFNYTPICLVYDPEMLENYLHTCIAASSNSIMQHNARVNITYTNLMCNHVEQQKYPESEFLKCILDSDRLKYLVEHAAVQTYTFIKWEKMKWIFWFFLLLNVLATTFVVLYTLYYSKESNLIRYCLIAGLTLFIIQFLLEIYIYKLHFFKHISVLVTLILITVISFSIVCFWIIDFENSSKYLMAVMSGVAQLATVKTFFQLETHPRFAVRIIILRIVLKKFLQAMLVYMLLIVSFAFSFHVLADEKQSYFYTLYNATLALGGHSDKELINPFDSNPIYGHSVHLLFVLLIGIVLPNLLIGLTISDITTVQKEAVHEEIKSVALYIVNFEELVISLRLRRFLKFLPNPNLFDDRKYLITIFPHMSKNVSINKSKRRAYKLKSVIDNLVKYIKKRQFNK